MTWEEDVKSLMNEVQSSGRNQDRVKRAFTLHNQNKSWPKESKHWCGGCVERVFKRLKTV